MSGKFLRQSVSQPKPRVAASDPELEHPILTAAPLTFGRHEFRPEDQSVAIVPETVTNATVRLYFGTDPRQCEIDVSAPNRFITLHQEQGFGEYRYVVEGVKAQIGTKQVAFANFEYRFTV